MERILKGDLVSIKKTEEVGIVIDIEMRSKQNPDWDVICVLLDGTVKEFSPRQMVKKNKKNVVKSVLPASKQDKLYIYREKEKE
jgi:ABC-type protease/lipase transport system fused ATPase/permease subunit